MSTQFKTLDSEALKALQKDLAWIDLFNNQSRPGSLEILVITLESVKLRIHKEARVHGRPHFHLEYKRGEYKASYALDTLEILAGHMPTKHSSVILEWAKENKSRIQAIWDELNASKPEFILQLGSSDDVE